MKNSILLFLIFAFCTKGFAQDINYENLYKMAFRSYFNPPISSESSVKYGKGAVLNKDKTLFTDTLIVQKENYLPSVWPDSIHYMNLANYHIVKYLSKDEIDNFGGKHISLMTMSPVRKNGEAYSIMIRTFGKNQKGWISRGYSVINFSVDPETKQLKLSQPIITFTNN